jgi:hypothetical protein
MKLAYLFLRVHNMRLWAITITIKRERVMSKYTKEEIKAMASDLCGIESDSEGVAAINKVIDYLTELAEGESDE